MTLVESKLKDFKRQESAIRHLTSSSMTAPTVKRTPDKSLLLYLKIFAVKANHIAAIPDKREGDRPRATDV